MGVLPKEEGQRDGRLLLCRQGFEGWSPEICGELFTGKGNEEKAGLLAGTGPCDLGGLYAPKGGTLRCFQNHLGDMNHTMDFDFFEHEGACLNLLGGVIFHAGKSM